MKLQRQFCSLYSRSILGPMGWAEKCVIGKPGALIDCNSYLVTEMNSLIRPKSAQLVQVASYKDANCVVKISHLRCWLPNKSHFGLAETSADLACINPLG